MDRRDFNKLGIGMDDLIEHAGYFKEIQKSENSRIESIPYQPGRPLSTLHRVHSINKRYNLVVCGGERDRSSTHVGRPLLQLWQMAEPAPRLLLDYVGEGHGSITHVGFRYNETQIAAIDESGNYFVWDIKWWLDAEQPEQRLARIISGSDLQSPKNLHVALKKVDRRIAAKLAESKRAKAKKLANTQKLD